MNKKSTKHEWKNNYYLIYDITYLNFCYSITVP